MELSNVQIAIVGLGYVGLPLAIEFGRRYPTIGFDTNSGRIDSLRQGHDTTLEATAEEILQASQLSFSDNMEDIADCNVYIVAVPTPIDGLKQPDLTLLRRATQSLAPIIRQGDLVIYESTVYPAQQKRSVFLARAGSGLCFNRDFCRLQPRAYSTQVTSSTAWSAS